MDLSARTDILQPTISSIERSAQEPLFRTAARLLDAMGYTICVIEKSKLK